MGRWKWLAALAVGFAVLAAGSALDFRAPRPPGPVNLENFDRIHSDMRREEVVALLGPTGDYRIDSTIPPSPRQMHERFLPPGAILWRAQVDSVDEWYTDSAKVSVVWGNSGSIIKATYVEMNPPDHSSLGRLLRAAKRLWRRWFT